MMHGHVVEISGFLELFILVFTFIVIISYIVAVYMTNRKYKKWPLIRVAFWMMGVLSITIGVIGPIAEKTHASFQAHMVNHLLLGMLGPLLIVLSAPMTLLLRSVPIGWGRFISKLLKSSYVRWITHPIAATLLNTGGLWILYTTDLYRAMHVSVLLYVLVHVHVLLAGYIFTLSIIYIDVTPHRTSFLLRAIVLVLSMAAHSILSKWIYANPPTGTTITDAQLGGMLMYYGGDGIELILVILLCYQYFRGKSKRREKALVY